MGELVSVIQEIAESAAAAAFQTQHTGKLPERNLDADSGQKTNQHGTRQKVCQESKADNPRQQYKGASHERKHCRKGHIFVRPGWRDTRKSSGENRRGSG